MKLNQIYQNTKSGALLEVVLPSNKLGEETTELKEIIENTTDAATEKHVPVIEKVDGGYKVIVGSVEHPMIEAHYIQWIELITSDMVFRKYLNAQDKPEAIFLTNATEVSARAYCNLHGLWKA